MAIPEEHKEYYKGVVEEHLTECQEQVAKYRKSLRLLEKGKTEPEYCIIITSYWKNVFLSEDEKDVELNCIGSLRDVIHDAEKQFMKINRRDDFTG